MKTKLLDDTGGRKTYVLVLDKGEEAVGTLTRFAADHRLAAAHVSAIGAFRDATLGYFDRQARDYRKIPVREQVEVLSLDGDVALDGDEPKLHLHVVVGRSDGTAMGGHLLAGRVWPTLEVILVESPSHLRRRLDAETGLALLDPAA